MTSAAQAVASKWQLGQAALRVIVQKESRALAAAMASIQEEVTGQLSILFGPDNREWSQLDLYDYTFLRDWVGARQLQRHLPEIAESFQKQYNAITEWRSEVKKYKAVMDPEPDDENQAQEVDRQWLMLIRFLAEVEAADDSLDQMLADY